MHSVFCEYRNWKDLFKPHFSIILFTSVNRFYTVGISILEIFRRPAEVCFENDLENQVL